MNRHHLLRRSACLALLLTSIVSLPGQVKPAATEAKPAATPTSVVPAAKDSADDEVIELSRFVVNAEEDEGYEAKYTLAGTRIRTDVKDVGSSITIVTSKFLEDTGSTNATQLLVYTPNTEVVGQGGNFLGNGDNQYAGQVRYGSNRVRGLSTADTTRDFFLSDIPWDSYNTGRIDIQRGPNSILFGIGSPAGIINAGLNHAGYRRSYKVENKVDNFGSLRFSGDFNQVLIDKELAVRVSLLNDETKFRQQPAFRDDKRFYTAMRWDPKFLNRGSMTTTFEANYENGRIRANLFRPAPPTDYITPWFNATPVGVQQNGVTFRTGTSADADPGLFYVGSGSDQLSQGGTLLAYNQNLPTALAFPHNVSSNVPWLGQAFYRGIMGKGVAFNNRGKNANTPIAGASIDAWKSTVITDRSIFDSYNILLDGDTKRENIDFDAFNAAFRQTFFDDTLGYELAYDYQHTHNFGYNYLGSGGSSAAGYGIGLDIMGTLAGGIIGGSANPAGGTFAEVADPRNPNFGRAYVVGARSSGWNWSDTEKDSWRATVYYNLDLPKMMGADSKIARIFGQNIFTGLVSSYATETKSGGGSAYFLDETSRIATGVAPLYILNYLSPRQFIRTSATAGDAAVLAGSAAGINLPGLSGLPVLAPTSRAVFNSTTKTYSNTTVNVLADHLLPEDQRTYSSSTGWQRRAVDTSAIVWQGHWLDGNVIPLAAYRTDSSWFNNGGFYNSTGVFTTSAPFTTTPTALGNRTLYHPFDSRYVLGEDGPKTKVKSKTYSVVTHTPKFLRNKLPGNIDVQLIYNQSENFKPQPGRTDIMNRLIADPSGKTKEYGFAISALDDKVRLKIVRYKTQEENVDIGALGNLSSLPAMEVWARSAAYVHDGRKPGGVGPTSGEFQADRIFGYSSSGRPVTFKPDGPWAVNAEVIGGAAGSTAGGLVTVWDGRTKNEPFPPGTVRQNYTQAEIDATWARQKAAIDAVINTPPPDAFITATGINRTTFFSPTGPGMFDYGGGGASATVTGNTESEGTEMELYANPIAGLTLTFNVSKTRAKRTSIAQSYLDYIDSRRPFFYGPAGDMRIWSSGDGDNANDPYTANFNASMNVAFRGQVDSPVSKFLAATNTYVPELHPWAFNGVANYAFQSSALKGLNVGGGIRWQDKLVTGYPITKDAFGNETFDLTKPYYGPTQMASDAWVGYERKIGRKYNWKIQLNVRNILANDKLVLSSVNPDGTGSAYRIPEPRTFVLSNTVEF